MPQGVLAAGRTPPGTALADYVALARPDHWFKNVFMLPGAALAIMLRGGVTSDDLVALFFGVLSTCLIASANYTINEWLDAEFDCHHPVKKLRPSSAGRIRGSLVYLQWGALGLCGLGIASLISGTFLVFSGLLLLMGIVYNVPPVRTKERPYIDVLSESINNPLRLVLGWAAIIPERPAASEHSPRLLDGRCLPHGGQALR